MPKTALSWGELLWDLFDDQALLGGCACNVAYHLAVLGQPVQLITRVGRDDLGLRARNRLQDTGVDVSLIQTDDEQPTGTVHVDTSGPEPKYTIAQRVAWDRIELTEQARVALNNTGAFIFGTLAQRTPLAQSTMAHALECLPQDCIKLLDLNLRRPFSLGPVIEASVRHANYIKLNQHETLLVGELIGVRDVHAWLIEECGVSAVIETRGAHGSITRTRDQTITSRGYPATPGGDTVGAGDAFAARFVAGLLRGETLEHCSAEANRYAARVASFRGATPDKRWLEEG